MLTGQFRASYAHVFEPNDSFGTGNPKYSITMLIPKSDVTTLNAIFAEIEKAKQEGVQKVFGGRAPAVLGLPIYDGDGVRPKTGEPFGEECRGCMVLTASSKQKPGVVDQNIQPIINPGDFYSGCYARATINFYAYGKNGNNGIGCGLNNIQKLADGEPLSGGSTPEEDFGQPAQAAAPQAAYPAQAQTLPVNMQASYQSGTQTYQPVPQQGAYPVFAQAPYGAYQAAVQPAYAPAGQQQAYPGQGAQIDPVTGRPMAGGIPGLQ